MGWFAVDNSKIVQNHSLGLETHFCIQTQCYMNLVWSYNACHYVLEVFKASARFSFLCSSLWEVKISFPTSFNNKVSNVLFLEVFGANFYMAPSLFFGKFCVGCCQRQICPISSGKTLFCHFFNKVCEILFCSNFSWVFQKGLVKICFTTFIYLFIFCKLSFIMGKFFYGWRWSFFCRGFVL
jgi:hypothetical protein